MGRLATGILAVVLAAAGCGGDSDADAPRGRDLTALECPMERTVNANGEERYTPAKNAFDTAELIGMELAEARAKAADHAPLAAVSSPSRSARIRSSRPRSLE